MLKKINLKKIAVFFIIFLSIILAKKPSFGTTGFKIFDNSPRMSVSCNKEKYDDVVIKFRDFSSLDPAKIKFYTVQNGVIGKEITDPNFLSKPVEKHYGVYDKSVLVDCIYTISNKYLNQKTNSFYVIATDKYNTPCKLEAFFKIKSTNGRYSADTAPRVINWIGSQGNCSFTVQDWVGVNYVRLYDMNSSNPSKIVLEKRNLPRGNSKISVQLKNFIQKNGKYQIKIITEDNNKKDKHIATRVVMFSLLPEDVSNDKISINTTSLSLRIGETYKLKATATSNTDKTVTWSTSNSKVAKVSSDGTVTAVAKGTATITAKLKSGKKATCSVTVKENSTSTAANVKGKQKLIESLRYAYRFSTQAGGHITYINSSNGDTRNRGRLEKGYSDCSHYVHRVFEHTGMMKKFVRSEMWGYHGCPRTKDVATFNKGEKWDYSNASPRRCNLGTLWKWKKQSCLYLFRKRNVN